MNPIADYAYAWLTESGICTTCSAASHDTRRVTIIACIAIGIHNTTTTKLDSVVTACSSGHQKGMQLEMTFCTNFGDNVFK